MLKAQVFAVAFQKIRRRHTTLKFDLNLILRQYTTLEFKTQILSRASRLTDSARLGHALPEVIHAHWQPTQYSLLMYNRGLSDHG